MKWMFEGMILLHFDNSIYIDCKSSFLSRGENFELNQDKYVWYRNKDMQITEWISITLSVHRSSALSAAKQLFKF